MRIQYYHKKDNSSVVTGLCGANCYHDYYPVVPGISKPTYTPEEIEEFNCKENEPVEYNGKTYTKYEATQRQRKLETTMRAQRQEIKLLKEGGHNDHDLSFHHESSVQTPPQASSQHKKRSTSCTIFSTVGACF